MARKNRGPHPSLLGGSPEHGDQWPEEPEDATNAELGEDDDEDEFEDDEEEEHTRQPTEAELLRQEIQLLRGKVSHMERLIPPPAAVSADDEEDEDDTDWETFMFADPKGAVKKIEDRAVAKAEKKLRREYQQDKSSTEFWQSFYATHNDLKESEDHDLVEVVLNKHLAELADLPVEKAMTKLADLTRQRIMRYSGGKAKKRSSRAVAEGSSTPSKKQPAPQKPSVTTLSDIIRTRKDMRRKAASAA